MSVPKHWLLGGWYSRGLMVHPVHMRICICGFRVAQYLDFCLDHYFSFCNFLFGHCLVCRLTFSDYPWSTSRGIDPCDSNEKVDVKFSAHDAFLVIISRFFDILKLVCKINRIRWLRRTHRACPYEKLDVNLQCAWNKSNTTSATSGTETAYPQCIWGFVFVDFVLLNI
jgi:hypothetical protein